MHSQRTGSIRYRVLLMVPSEVCTRTGSINIIMRGFRGCHYLSVWLGISGSMFLQASTSCGAPHIKSSIEYYSCCPRPRAISQLPLGPEGKFVPRFTDSGMSLDRGTLKQLSSTRCSSTPRGTTTNSSTSFSTARGTTSPPASFLKSGNTFSA
jgi:hypothetical protein